MHNPNSKEFSEVRAKIEQSRQTRPMDIVDETLADIASDTKGEAWRLGYNAAIDDTLALVDELFKKPL